MRAALNRIGGPHGLSFSAWLLLAPISIFFTQEVVPEGLQPSDIPFAGILVGLIGHFVTGVVLLAAKLTLLRDTKTQPKPFATLATMALAGAARGYSVAFSLEWFGLVAQADYLERMRSGAVLIVIWFSIAGLVIDSRSSYRASFSSLAQSVDEQMQIRSRGEELIAKSRNQILDQIKSTLRAALQFGAKRTDIHLAVDDLIRPLSHRLAEDASGLLSPVAPAQKKIRARSVVKTALTENAYYPLATATMAIFGTITSKIWSEGLIAIFGSGIEFLVIWGLLTLAKRLNLFGPLAPLAWVITGLVSSATGDLIVNPTPLNSPLTIAYLAVNVFVPAALFAFLGAYQTEAERNLEKLRDNLAVLRWEISALEQRLWVERKRLSRFVHSELQSRLRAFALRLDFRSQDPSPEELERLREECERALVFDDESQSLKSVLLMQRELWEGVMNVDFDLNNPAVDLLENDSYAANCAALVVREGLANAVKHGKASIATIDFRAVPLSEQLNLIEIVIANDGLEPNPLEIGLGTKTLAELTSNYSLVREGEKTVLRATLPARVESMNVPS